MLIGIVVGVLLLVGVAFAVTLLQPKPSYQPDDTPEGVAHNYLFALQENDYDRARGYLSPTLEGYPETADEFVDGVERQSWMFRENVETTMAVESADIDGDRAVVIVRESRYYGGGLFESWQDISTFEMELHREDGAWRITDADFYFADCWRFDGCSY
jgi:hypothetical protein